MKGPFEFGPTIAATGVKRYDTIPRFPTVADQQASSVRQQSSPLPSAEYWQTSTGNFKNAKSADNERHLFQTLHQIHCNDAVQDKQTIEVGRKNFENFFFFFFLSINFNLLLNRIVIN